MRGSASSPRTGRRSRKPKPPQSVNCLKGDTTCRTEPSLKVNRLAPLLVIFILLIQIPPASAAIQYRYVMTCTFENKGTTTETLTRDDISIPLFIDNQWQKIKISASTPPLGVQYSDEDGNKLAETGIPFALPAGAKQSYKVTYEIETSEKPKPKLEMATAGKLPDIPSNLIFQYTGSTKTFMANNTEIAKLAKSLTDSEPTVLGKLTLLINWFYSNIMYDNAENPRFPDETLKIKKGDCDDQSILLISMLRSLGIPAYMEIGVYINSGITGQDSSWEGHLDISQKGIGWHGWAIVYVPPYGWIPVDLTLVKDKDPFVMLRDAPEYGSSVVTVFKISNQEYTTLSKETRERIVASNIFVSMTDAAEPLQTIAWVNPAVLVLGATLLAAIILMFYTARRSPFKLKPTI
jgi:hypothetical protein